MALERMNEVLLVLSVGAWCNDSNSVMKVPQAVNTGVFANVSHAR